MTSADDNSRQALLDRREALKRRMERRRVSAQARITGHKLCERGVKFSKLMPEACRMALGRLAALPARDERFYWPDIPGSTQEFWEDDTQRDQLFAAALQRCTQPDEKLAVIWHTHEAGLRLAASDLTANLSAFLEDIHDAVWIVAAKNSAWLIEIQPREREICGIKIQLS